MFESTVLSRGTREPTQAVHLWFIPPPAIQMFPINHDHQWIKLSESLKYFIDRQNENDKCNRNELKKIHL